MHVAPFKTQLRVEALEDRCVPDCKTISGYVFHDLNNDGLRQGNEPILANSNLELRNAAGVVVARTKSDANGFYLFETDATIDDTPKTQSHSVTIPENRTNANQNIQMPEFDPVLGVLKSVEIRVNGSVTSTIKVENRDPSPALIDVTVAGTLKVSGPGFNMLVTTNTNSKQFDAAAFDGTLDYGGASGKNFGSVTVNGTATKTITDASDLAAYLGTGEVTLTGLAQASTSANGGGNLDASISSTGGAEITLIYHYAPDNCLKPGEYVIVQSNQLPGFIDGLESRNGNVLPGSGATDRIKVTLGDQDLVNNNFAELLPTSIGGFVYVDKNNDGIRDTGEKGIAGVKVTLKGTNDLGEAITLVQNTGTNGSYLFATLRPGTYSLTEVQPTGYFDGKDRAGNVPATVTNDSLANVVLGQDVTARNYNFGELQPSSLSGVVFHDVNENGKQGSSEPGIAGVKVTLTGTDDLGNVVNVSKQTNAKGEYKFGKLRPGTYVITETQPGGYKDGKDAAGTLGGTAGDDVIAGILVDVFQDGVNYNFAEIRSGGTSTGDPDEPWVKLNFLASVILRRAGF